MSSPKTMTFVLMDPPFESARSTTALRLIDQALRRRNHVNVFAYEGAVALSFAGQKPHPNGVHGRDVEAEDHPLPREWIAALFDAARSAGVRLEWVNCGLCVDERGVEASVPGPRRGGPPDLARFLADSDNALVIPTAD